MKLDMPCNTQSKQRIREVRGVRMIAGHLDFNIGEFDEALLHMCSSADLALPQ
ncbi:hypothetical protein D3C80_1787660 [compost metagenome]